MKGSKYHKASVNFLYNDKTIGLKCFHNRRSQIVRKLFKLISANIHWWPNPESPDL